jgi:uncharacterized membrane protein YagU involved in acid resistance
MLSFPAEAKGVSRKKNTKKLDTHFRFSIPFLCLAFVEIIIQRVAKGVHTYRNLVFSILVLIFYHLNFGPTDIITSGTFEV